MMTDITTRIQHRIDEVRQYNQSHILGSPLEWPREWRRLAHVLEGWTSGLLLISGQSNHGKSAVAMALGLEIVRSNPNATVIDFTMDDDLRDRMSRYIAILSGLTPYMVKMEYRYRNLQPDEGDSRTYLKYLEQGYDLYRAHFQDRLLVVDGETIALLRERKNRGLQPYIGDITHYTTVIRQELMARQPDHHLIVIIDSLNDLAVDNSVSDNDRLSRIAGQLMSLGQNGVRIIATTHARKMTSWSRPSMDDVYGASSLKYAAKVITFVYNDLKVSGNESPMKEERPTPSELLTVDFLMPKQVSVPILIWSVLKNKTSPFSGNLFLRMDPLTTQVSMLEDDDVDFYARQLEAGLRARGD